jgi:hypothetical protein
MSKMFDSGFDPYQALIDLDARLNAVHRAHDALARDYMQTQRDLDILLESHQHLQQAHLQLSKTVVDLLIDNKETK